MKRDRIKREGPAGFEFEMSAAELAAHCKRRHAHHLARAKHYEKEAEKLPIRPLEPVPAYLAQQALSTYQQPDPRQQTLNYAQQHRLKAVRFKFAAAHVIRGHRYRFEIDAMPSELELGETE